MVIKAADEFRVFRDNTIPAENRRLAPLASSAAAFFVERIAAGNQNIVHILIGEAQACHVEELGLFDTRMAFSVARASSE